MPRFTLIKHPDHENDSEVTVSFSSELLPHCQEVYEDFLKAAGFEIPIDEPKLDLDKIVLSDDYIASEDDWMWTDAFESKFRNDGPVGSEGTDNVINFPISDS